MCGLLRSVQTLHYKCLLQQRHLILVSLLRCLKHLRQSEQTVEADVSTVEQQQTDTKAGNTENTDGESESSSALDLHMQGNNSILSEVPTFSVSNPFSSSGSPPASSITASFTDERQQVVTGISTEIVG